ncbi:hypothetical protein BUALT_Bualt18G0028100 [Buddleja alternifolia]|uniref:Serine acetyltransferase N-terminal domain-containing protein n=1 Tax=Buddleja alternifolia TaxID=168488 RepID=A0AAV6WCR2_9LAMI|nr:hypothetical protein BUALT_Bualt18G0028100 [Buddleja alternifolia]
MGRVGDGVVIRVGTCALGNIRVQNDAKIRAGSMAVKPVPAGSTVGGSPARLIGVEVNPAMMVPQLISVVTRSSFICQLSIFIPFNHSTSTNAACIRFLFKHSPSTKATFYETVFSCLSYPMPIHEKNSKSPEEDLSHLMKEEVKLDVEQKPLLSAYYLSTILAHNCLAGALENSLSQKLSTFSLPSDTPSQLFLGVLTEDQKIMEAVIDDLRVAKEKNPAKYLKYLPLIFILGQKLDIEIFSILGWVGDGVVNRVGTCALGNIRVQNEAKIGAGSMALKPVPVGSTVGESWEDLSQLMKEEVKLDVEQKPLVSEYYLSTILACNSMAEDQEIMEAVIDDLRVIKEKDPASISHVHCFLKVKGFLACQGHRIEHDLRAKGRKTLALLIQKRLSEIFAIDGKSNPARWIGVEVSIFIPFKHSTSTNAACIRFLFKHSPSTKAAYYETGFSCLSYPMHIHEKNSKSPVEDLSHLVKEEVKLDVEQKPLLSAYYLSTILAHNCLAGALENSLSQKLSTSSVPSDTPSQLFLGVRTEDQEIKEAVIDDLRVVTEKDHASISHVQCF